MIQHILLFKFNETTKKSDIQKIINKFEECRHIMKGFISLEHGENISSKKELSQGFQYGVIMTFKDERSIQEYNQLALHRKAQELQKPFVKEKLVFDIQS